MKIILKFPSDHGTLELDSGSPVPRIGDEVVWGDAVVWEVFSVIWNPKDKEIIVECG